jgi:cell fate regulator YaaT (PSP1 superfamily)
MKNSSEIVSVFEIEFKGNRRGYFSNPQEFPLEVGDNTIVQVEKGEDLGTVSHAGWKKGEEEDESPPFQLVRKALAEDLQILQQNREKEKAALTVARQKAREHQLEMKFIGVELQWDGRKITFYFTADGRIDFRELVKDFAATYRTRIDLRQIGARDETRKLDGYGICGRQLCCATWLSEFHPITTQMPRDQSLPLNPAKLSGLCGRLKCCLRYELDSYKEFLEHSPIPDQKVSDPKKGAGTIDKVDVITEQIHIQYEKGETEKLSLEEFKTITDWKDGMKKDQLIAVCARPEPITESEPPPPEKPTKKPPPSKEKNSATKPQKKKERKKGPGKPPQAKDDKPPSAQPESSQEKSEDTSKAAKKNSRRRRRPRKKKPPKSNSTS